MFILLPLTLHPERVENPSVDVLVVKFDRFFRVLCSDEELEVKVTAHDLELELLIHVILNEHAVGVS